MNVVNGIPGLCCSPLVRCFFAAPKNYRLTISSWGEKSIQGDVKKCSKKVFWCLEWQATCVEHIVNSTTEYQHLSLSHTRTHTHKYAHSLSHSHCLLVFIFLAWWRCFFVFICGILGWKGSQGCTWASSFYNPSLSLPFFTLSQSLFLCHAFSWDF